MSAQRIAPAAAPGSLLKGSAPPKKRKLDLGRSPRDRDEAHLHSLRSLPCLACGLEGQSQAAHIRFSSARDGKRNPGLGRRPDDSACVPLCDTCHRDQHAAGDERAWWDAQNIDPLKAADALYRAPDNETQRQVVALFRAAQLIERQT